MHDHNHIIAIHYDRVWKLQQCVILVRCHGGSDKSEKKRRVLALRLRLFDLMMYALAMAMGMENANGVNGFDIHGSTEWTARIAGWQLVITTATCS